MRPIKKLRSDSDQELDMLIYNQDEEIHKLRDDITKIESSKTFQKHILELNKQVVPNGELDVRKPFITPNWTSLYIFLLL